MILRVKLRILRSSVVSQTVLMIVYDYISYRAKNINAPFLFNENDILGFCIDIYSICVIQFNSMILEFLRNNRPEAIHSEQLTQAADELVTLQQSRRRLVLDKTGAIPENTITSLLDTISQRSMGNRYVTPDGRPIRYWVNHLDANELSSLNCGDTFEVFQTRLAQFAASIPQYAERVLNEIKKNRYLPEAIKKTNDPVEAFEYTFRQKLEYESTTRKSIQIRELLKTFANPPNYSTDFGRVRNVETDHVYPTLVPIFNIRFENLPEDPQAALDDFNRRFNENELKIRHGEIKMIDIFSNDELTFARQCRSLVDFTDGLYYSTFDLPSTNYVNVVPLFPYEVIRRRYSYAYEGWLNFGPNDELYEAVRSMSPLKV